MPRHAAVRVDDDLAAGQAGVAHGTTDDKTAGRIDVDLGLYCPQLRRDDRLDDHLDHVVAQAIVAHLIVVLRRDDDVAHGNGSAT